MPEQQQTTQRPWSFWATVWILAGIAGLIASFVALGMKGDMTAKVAGPLYAILLGPFYWVYFAILHSKGHLAVKA